MTTSIIRVINLDEVVAGIDHLESALENFPGVRRVQVKAATKEATIEHDNVPLDKILEAVKQRGFEVRVVEGTPAQSK